MATIPLAPRMTLVSEEPGFVEINLAARLVIWYCDTEIVGYYQACGDGPVTKDVSGNPRAQKMLRLVAERGGQPKSRWAGLAPSKFDESLENTIRFNDAARNL